MEDADEQASIKLHNQSVLDCPICFHPLTIPVFQCDYNGHIACSSCHGKIIRQGKCPTCSMRLGSLRNRAIESVLDNLEISCSYKFNGCPAKTLYSEKRSHEDACRYSTLYTVACPFPGCNFRGCKIYLYDHLRERHTSSVFLLQSSDNGPRGGRVQFSLGESDELVAFLQEDYCFLSCSLFLLNMKDGRLRINTIEDPRDYSRGRSFNFMLTAGAAPHNSGCFRFDSVTSPLRDADIVAQKTAGSNCLSQDFLRLLGYFFGDDGRITLDLMTWDDWCDDY